MRHSSNIFSRRRIPFIICLFIIACAVVFIPMVIRHGRPAYIESTRNHMWNIQIALQEYYYDWSEYPGSLDRLCAESKKGSRYLDKETPLKDSWGNPFTYRIPGKHSPEPYDLYSFGPNGIDDFTKNDDVLTWEDN